jgi:hypothetical protein
MRYRARRGTCHHPALGMEHQTDAGPRPTRVRPVNGAQMPQDSVHPYKGDPRFVDAGRDGARRRWGAPRHVRLDSLDPRVREAVLALVRADQRASSREAGESEGTL